MKQVHQVTGEYSDQCHVFIKKDLISGVRDPGIAGNNRKTDHKSNNATGNDDAGAEPDKSHKNLLPHKILL